MTRSVKEIVVIIDGEACISPQSLFEKVTDQMIRQIQEEEDAEILRILESTIE